MAVSQKNFDWIRKGIGYFNVKGTTLVFPTMNPLTSPLLGAVFESYGVNCHVLDTYIGLELGKKHTSGKECFPCQVTLGDILHFLFEEKKRVGASFKSRDYSIFFPGADGPCRFGMYTKFKRIVLDSYPDFKDVRFASMSTESGYAVGGLIEQSRSRDFRKMAYTATIIGDLLERLLWRIRPYEREKGLANEYIKKSHERFVEIFRGHAVKMEFDPIYETLRDIYQGARDVMDPSIGQKPLIGIVGEIYVRTHVQSNQNVIELLEKHGAEVVNASIGEWVNYTTYDQLVRTRDDLLFHAGRFDFSSARSLFKNLLKFSGDSFYQKFRHKSLYKTACESLPVHADHEIGALDRHLRKSGEFCFHIPGEACLSIAGAMLYREHGFSGVVNIYPFTCMPSTITSSILKPWFHKKKFPYMDAAYDGSYQPGREAVIRTFMYQAQQYFQRNQGNRTQ